MGLAVAAPMARPGQNEPPEFLNERTEFYVPSALSAPMVATAFDDCFGCVFCDDFDRWVESSRAAERAATRFQRVIRLRESTWGNPLPTGSDFAIGSVGSDVGKSTYDNAV